MEPLTFERYALAGNATFTLVSRRTGKHLTFNVRLASSGNCWYVNGPNREKLGWITRSELNFRTQPDANNAPDYAAAFRWAWNHRISNPHRFDFRPSGRCCRCGRQRTTPESLDAGIGPECAEALENL